ncbi:uncharacterized protein LOC122818569 isoform X1 [Drosophila biarmipes]|uniref:uncharacterized protein LOC122818569 isoform X1 n=1 Tax=Drosophila biarmipes TaxID=125945 RepID=UPI0021CC83D2|nr:uncharacterized protein LOC122818569 isoform X1 [Drosophila biarmipes]
MKVATAWLFIILNADMNECGLKSHAELILQAIKVDNKIKDLVRKVTGFAKGNSEFKEKYENLRIPLMENYTSLHKKLDQVRVFETYNKERLHLEKNILMAIYKINTSSSENCKKFHKNLRKHLVLKLSDSNINKNETLKNLKDRICQEKDDLTANNNGHNTPTGVATIPSNYIPSTKITRTSILTTTIFNNIELLESSKSKSRTHYSDIFVSTAILTTVSKKSLKRTLKKNSTSSEIFTSSTSMIRTNSAKLTVSSKYLIHQSSSICGTVREVLPCRKFLVLSTIPGKCFCLLESVLNLVDSFLIDGQKFKI